MASVRFNTTLVPGRSYLCNANLNDVAEILASFDTVDTLVFDGAQSDVKSARTLVAQAQLGAMSARRLLMVTDAHLMSETVQNTLLKLLEEPPSSVVIVLQTEQAQRLLPTIISRLHAIKVTKGSSVPSNAPSDQLPNSFDTLAELDRDKLVELLANVMRAQKHLLLTNPSQIISNRISLIDTAIKKLNANANLKLTVDWLLLRWDATSGYTKD